MVRKHSRLFMLAPSVIGKNKQIPKPHFSSIFSWPMLFIEGLRLCFTSDYFAIHPSVKMLKFTDLLALEKKWQFRLLYNLETLKFNFRLDSNPGPCASQSDPLSTIPNFLMKIFSNFFSQMLKDFCNLSVAESPVGSSKNRRFLLNRQKTRNAHIFWPRPNFSMKFSKMYRKVHNLKVLL